jgi:hypothetical protein
MLGTITKGVVGRAIVFYVVWPVIPILLAAWGIAPDWFWKLVLGPSWRETVPTLLTQDNVRLTLLIAAVIIFGFWFFYEIIRKLRGAPVSPGGGPIVPDVEVLRAQAELERQRRLTLKEERTRTKIVAVSPAINATHRPDLDVVEAFDLLLTQSKWAKDRAEHPERMPAGWYENSAATDADRITGRLKVSLNREIHDALRLGRIAAWGRPGTTSGGPMTPIKPEEWDDIVLDFEQRFVSGGRQPFIGAFRRPQAKPDRSLAYVDVKFSRDQIQDQFSLLDEPFKLPTYSIISRVSFLRFRELAKGAYKWDVSGKDNCEILDLIDGLRQAGVDGAIRFWGKYNPHGQEEAAVTEPLIPIPVEHWRDYEIEAGSAINTANNETTATYNFKRSNSCLRGGYLDIHLHEPEAVKWLNTSAETYRGRRDRERVRTQAPIEPTQLEGSKPEHFAAQGQVQHNLYTDGSYAEFGPSNIRFKLRFSAANDKSVHLYRDDLDYLARIRGKKVGDRLRLQDYEGAKESFTIAVGEHFIAKDKVGQMVQGKIIEVKNDRFGADHNEVTFEYVVAPARGGDFIAL